MRRIHVLTGLVAGAVALSCGGDGGTSNTDTPTPGNLTVTLDASAPAGGGAIELTVSGGSHVVDTVVASGGFTIYQHRQSTGLVKVVLIGTMTGGALASVHVPDTRKAASYAVTVLAVANNSTYAAMVASQFPVTLVAP
jgi:hypothetical protein